MKTKFKIYTLAEFKEFLRKNNLYSEDVDYGDELWNAIKGEEVILEVKKLSKDDAALYVIFKMRGYNN